MEYQATPDPVESDLKVLLILHRVTKFFEGLEASFQSSECMLDANANLNQLKVSKYSNEQKNEHIRERD